MWRSKSISDVVSFRTGASSYFSYSVKGGGWQVGYEAPVGDQAMMFDAGLEHELLELKTSDKQALQNDLAYLKAAPALLFAAKIKVGGGAIRAKHSFYLILGISPNETGKVRVCFVPAQNDLEELSGLTALHASVKNLHVEPGKPFYSGVAGNDGLTTITIHKFTTNTNANGTAKMAVQNGTFIRIQTTGLSSEAKPDLWAKLLLGTSCAAPQVKRVSKAPVMQLPPVGVAKVMELMAANKRNGLSEQELVQYDEYKGGKEHLRVLPFSQPQEASALMRTRYIPPNELISDMHLLEQMRVDSRYFQCEGSAGGKARAVREMRRILESDGKVAAEDSERIMGAVASAIHQDLGWRQRAEPECVENARIDTLSVDVDQATMHIPRLCMDGPADVLPDGGVDRNAFLKRHCMALLAEGIFCPNNLAMQTALLFVRETNYNYNMFMYKTAFGGGHTYMPTSVARRFVRINPTERDSLVLKMSVRTTARVRSSEDEQAMTDKQFADACLKADQQLMWDSIMDVSEWWDCCGPMQSEQSRLRSAARRVVANHAFQVGGGPLLHVLAALWFAVKAKIGGMGPVEFVTETYATKKAGHVDVHLMADEGGLTLTTEEQKRVSQKLMEELSLTPPTQIMRLHRYLVKGLHGKDRGEVTMGVGATVTTKTDDGVPLFPVINCMPCPWDGAVQDRKYFADAAPKNRVRTGTVSNRPRAEEDDDDRPGAEEDDDDRPGAEEDDEDRPGAEDDASGAAAGIGAAAAAGTRAAAAEGKKAFRPFVPLQHVKRYCTYPIYGNVLPERMQPCTLNAQRSHRLEQMIVMPPGAALQSSEIRRVQQYCVTTRESEKMSYHLGEYPVLKDNSTGAVLMNLEASRANVHKFAAMVATHFSNAKAWGGVRARVEMAVVVSTAAADEDLASTVNRAVHDVVAIAQHHMRSYILEDIAEMVNFFVAGLKARVDATIIAIAPNAMTSAEADLLKREEVANAVIEISTIIRHFYGGKGVLRATGMALTKTAYVHNRPILRTVGARIGKVLEGWLDRGADVQGKRDDYLQLFRMALGWGACAVVPTPEFTVANKGYRHATMALGMACPCCRRIFAQTDPSGYMEHLCPESNSQPRRPDWVSIHTPDFKAEHERMVKEELTDQQRLFLDLLDDRFTLNMFLMGVGGAGKSFAVRAAIEHCYINFGMLSTAVIAPTNIAATNIAGQTLHSFLGRGKESLNVADAEQIATDFITKHEQTSITMMHNLRYVFVDEAAMLTAQDLEILNVFLRRVCSSKFDRGKCSAFGGVKVILVGDVLQTQPVDLYEGGGYIFQSQVFTDPLSNFMVVYFKGSKRTALKRFIIALMRFRLGMDFVRDEDLEYSAEWGSKVSDECALRVCQELAALFAEIEKAGTLDDPKALERWKTFFKNLGEPKNGCVTGTPWFVNPDRVMNPVGCSGRGTRVEQRDAAARSESPRMPPPYVMCAENEEINHFNEAYKRECQLDASAIQDYESKDEWPAGLEDSDRKNLVDRESFFTLPHYTYLAPGMRVRYCWNKCVPGIARNSLGVVDSIDEKEDAVFVLFSALSAKNGATQTVRITRVRESVTWQGRLPTQPTPSNGVGSRKKSQKQKKTFVTATLTAHRSQFPLVVCAAANHYTVQGQTLASIVTIFNNARINRHAYGAAYTMISRMVDPAYLCVLFKLTKHDFVASKIAARFDQYHYDQPLIMSAVNYTWKPPLVAGNKLNKYLPTVVCGHPAGQACKMCKDWELFKQETEACLCRVEDGKEDIRLPADLTKAIRALIVEKKEYTDTVSAAASSAPHVDDAGMDGWDGADAGMDVGDGASPQVSPTPRRRRRAKSARAHSPASGSSESDQERAAAVCRGKRRRLVGADELTSEDEDNASSDDGSLDPLSLPLQPRSLHYLGVVPERLFEPAKFKKSKAYHKLIEPQKRWLGFAYTMLDRLLPKHDTESIKRQRAQAQQALDAMGSSEVLLPVPKHKNLRVWVFKMCLAYAWCVAFQTKFPVQANADELYDMGKAEASKPTFANKMRGMDVLVTRTPGLKRTAVERGVSNEGDLPCLPEWKEQVFITNSRMVYIFDD